MIALAPVFVDAAGNRVFFKSRLCRNSEEVGAAHSLPPDGLLPSGHVAIDPCDNELEHVAASCADERVVCVSGPIFDRHARRRIEDLQGDRGAHIPTKAQRSLFTLAAAAGIVEPAGLGYKLKEEG